MVASILALIVALVGTSYAGFRLGKNSVGKRQLKDNAVGTKEVRNGSLLKGDFKAEQLPASDGIFVFRDQELLLANNTDLQTVLTTTPPAGNYMVMASATVDTDGNNVLNARCALAATGGMAPDASLQDIEIGLTSDAVNADTTTISLSSTLVQPAAAELQRTLDLRCSKDVANDQVGVTERRIWLIAVETLTATEAPGP